MSDEESVENVSLAISLSVEKLLARNRHLKELCARAADALEEDQPMVKEPICDLGAARNRQALITELREAAKS